MMGYAYSEESVRPEGGEHSDSLFYLDTNARFAYVNECCCKDMGYSREELIAKALDELGVLTDSRNFQSMFRLCMDGRTCRLEMAVRRKDGSMFPAEISITQAPCGNRMLLRCDLHNTGR
jgi:PAS domain S-box-containing protein